MKRTENAPLPNKKPQTEQGFGYLGVAISNMQASIEKNKRDLEGLEREIKELREQIKHQLNIIMMDDTDPQERQLLSDSISVEKNIQLLASLTDRAEILKREIARESKNLADLQLDIHDVSKGIFSSSTPLKKQSPLS